MHRISTRIALIAVIGAMAITSPVLAAPNDNPSNRGRGIDCTVNPTDPWCMVPNGNKGGRHPGASNDNNTNTNTNTSGGGSPGNGKFGNHDHQHNDGGTGGNGQGNNNPAPPPPQQGDQGPGKWSHRDRDQFHQRFGNFDFGFFPMPNFSIQLGVHVPHSYDLRPVPRSIYRVYPQFRGFLYFETRHGDFVIVSPGSHRIVAII